MISYICLNLLWKEKLSAWLGLLAKVLAIQSTVLPFRLDLRNNQRFTLQNASERKNCGLDRIASTLATSPNQAFNFALQRHSEVEIFDFLMMAYEGKICEFSY